MRSQRMYRRIIGALVACAVASLPVGGAAAATLNFSMGEDAEGTGQETVSGQGWNNLSGGATIGSLQYADGSAATGVTVTQAGSGANPNDGTGNGYVTGLNDVTQSLVFSTGATSTTLVVAGLTPGSIWNASVFAGLNEGPARTQSISVNGVTYNGLGFGAVYASGAPVAFNTVAATGGGTISVTAFNGNTSGIEFMQAVSLTSAATVGLTAGTQIGIDMGPTLSSGWNNFTANGTRAAGTVVDLAGHIVDGVSVTVAGAAGFNNDGTDNWVGLSTNGGDAPVPFIDAVTTDIAFGSGSPITVTINGLSDSLSYDITAVSVAIGTATEVLTINGVESSQFTRANARDNGVFHSFFDIFAINGTITMQFTQTAGTNPIVNGILITAVPAPAALPAGLALTGLVAARRRRR